MGGVDGRGAREYDERVRRLEDAEHVALERFRAMTPSERWKAARALYWSARRFKTAHIRQQHPEWTDTQVDQAVRRSFMYVRG